MYRLLPDAGAAVVSLTIDGKPITVPQGTSVAAALLLAAAVPSRTSLVRHTARAPYCMMGVCFECLVEIDGVADRQACMITAVDGMRVRCAVRRPPPVSA
jgi:predicted molibdopterin-dependent oxidoreductase YjgC